MAIRKELPKNPKKGIPIIDIKSLHRKFAIPGSRPASSEKKRGKGTTGKKSVWAITSE